MTALEEFRRHWSAAMRVLRDGAVIAAAPARAAPVHGAPVCIVRVDGIGDFVLWLEACKRLAAHYRAAGSRVVLVANVLFAEWARELGLADEVWEFDRVRFVKDEGYRTEWLRRMRAAGFGSVLQPAHSRRATESDALVRASGAPQRIGPSGDSTNSPAWLQRRADRWYTRLVNCGSAGRAELLRNADFMRALGFADFHARAPVLSVGLPANPLALAPQTYAVLVPGAGYDMRAWPIASFAEIGRRLVNAGLRIVVAGGPKDRPLADELLRALGDAAEDWTGRTSLGQLAAMLRDARLAVTNETGASHIAAAAGTQVVCVMGGGHYGRFMPYTLEEGAPQPAVRYAVQQMACFGCNWNCIYPRAAGEPVKCIKDVSVVSVWSEAAACIADSTPEDAGSRFHLGVALQGEGRYDEAHGEFREALRLRLRGEMPTTGPRVPVPRTTLVCVDCRHHELAAYALRRSMAQCRFERAQFFTNRPVDLPGVEVVLIPDIGSIEDYSRFMLKSLGERIDTDFALVVQYDGWVLNGTRWREEFLNYDYIGAPWSRGGVGNGGFSLRSKKLMQATRDARITELVPEDVAICETYRDLLEKEYGIRFARADVAGRFAFETLPPPEPTLGFHGIAHMIRLVNMSEDEIARYRPEPMVTFEK